MIVLTKVECSRVLHNLQTMALQEGNVKRWQAGGRPHPIQRGAFGPVVGHVRITSVLQIRLGQLTDEDAQRCGYSSLSSLKAQWRADGKRWHPHKRIWALKFVYNGVPVEYKQTNLLDLLREVNEPCGKA